MDVTQFTAAFAKRLIGPSRVLSRTRPVWFTVLIAAALLNFAVYLFQVHGFLNRNSFRLYYAGAQVGLNYGWSRIYDTKLHQAAVAALPQGGPMYPWFTPPPIAWLVAPLTAFGYPAAYWIWVAVSVAILGAAAWYARPRQYPAAVYFCWWIALGPLWNSAYEGQVTILMAAAVLAGWRLLESRRDLLGGAVLATTVFKPHLVLLLPLALLASGRWRALAGFGAVAAVAGVGSVLTLGPGGVRDYLVMLRAATVPIDEFETLLGTLGGGTAVRVILTLVVILVVALIAVHARRTKTAWPLVVSALLGSFFLAIYWHSPDYVVLDTAAAIMLAAGPLEASLLVASGAVILLTPLTPLTGVSPLMVVAWLIFAIVWFAFLGVRALTHYGRSIAPSEAEPISTA